MHQPSFIPTPQFRQSFWIQFCLVLSALQLFKFPPSPKLYSVVVQTCYLKKWLLPPTSTILSFTNQPTILHFVFLDADKTSLNKPVINHEKECFNSVLINRLKNATLRVDFVVPCVFWIFLLIYSITLFFKLISGTP